MARFRRCSLAAIFTLGCLMAGGCPRREEAPAQSEGRQNPGIDPRPARRIGGEISGLHGAAARRPGEPEEVPAAAAIGPAVEEAAARGEVWAQTMLGKNQVTTARDEDALRAGAELLRKAAEQGDAEAQYELAALYAEGRGTEQDMDLALLWGKKAAAQGYVAAQFSVGRTLIESKEPANKAEALVFLRRAATARDRTSAIFLATVLARGDFGVSKDEREAESVLKPMAEAGDAECQFALANLYRMGTTFQAGRELSAEWLKKAAAQGHPQATQALQSLR